MKRVIWLTVLAVIAGQTAAALAQGQFQPNAYQAQPNAYQAQPNAYQAQPNAYQAQPNAYQAQPNGYQTQPNGYQTQPNGYQSPNGYQTQPGDYQPQPEDPTTAAAARRDPDRPPAIPPAEMYQRIYPQGFHPYLAIPRRCTACECCNDPYPPCADPTSWTFLDCLCDLNTELWHGVLDPCCAGDCCEGSRCHNRSFGLLDLCPRYRREKLAQRHGCGGPPGVPGNAGVGGGCASCGGTGFLGHYGYGSPDGYIGCLEQYHVPRGWIPSQPMPRDFPQPMPLELGPHDYPQPVPVQPGEIQPGQVQPGAASGVRQPNPSQNRPASFEPQPRFQYQGRPDPQT